MLAKVEVMLLTHWAIVSPLTAVTLYEPIVSAVPPDANVITVEVRTVIVSVMLFDAVPVKVTESPTAKPSLSQLPGPLRVQVVLVKTRLSEPVIVQAVALSLTNDAPEAVSTVAVSVVIFAPPLFDDVPANVT